MDFRIERVAVGVRFKMSRFGAIQCPSLADRVGIVLELSPSNTGVTVLFDGDRRPTPGLHISGIRAVSIRSVMRAPQAITALITLWGYPIKVLAKA